MHVRFTKILFRNAHRRVELTGEVKNALNEMGTPSIRSQIYNNANFLVTNTYPEPGSSGSSRGCSSKRNSVGTARAGG